MHPRLRRQLETAGEVSQKLLEAVDAAYRAADADQALLEESVRALTTLLSRAQLKEAQTGKRKAVRRERAAKAARRLLRLLDKSGLAVLELNPDLTVRSANAAAERICGGAPAKEAPGLAGRGLLELLEPLEAKAVAERWRRKLSRGVPIARTLACSARDGRALACDFVCLPRLRKDGKLFRVTVLVRDQTETLEKQEALRESEERHRFALQGASDVLWDWDLRSSRLVLSATWREILGLKGEPSGVPAEWLDRVHPEDAAPLRAALSAHFEGRTSVFDLEHRLRHENGEWRWIAARGAARRDPAGTAVRVAGLMSDVTRHRLLVERMAHDARHDALSGLPNRTLFLDLLRHSFNRTRRHEDYRFAVLFIDIDRFKTVNDAFGHEAGDQLLQQIARRLTSCLREGDTLARHGGDEFTMWLDDVQRGAADAMRVADRVHVVMREPFELAGQRVNSSASIGVAVGSSSYKQAEDVLRDADVAMYRAKALGKARTAVFQREGGDTTHPASPNLEADLRTALSRNELLLHYMPIVDVQTGRVKGLEALARWQHPRLGLVPPAKFLGMAMETGLIVSIDQFVLQTASRQLHDWRSELPAAARLSISVNFSQNLLEQRDLGAQIDRVLEDAHLAPADLNLDINESSLCNGDTPGGMLAELHGRGLGVHMDDFGIGNSWLRHLHNSKVDSIKVDRSFLADRQVMGRLVSIARDLGKQVIAEGVETADQLRLVRELGCNSAQGFFFTPPLDVLKARTLLQGAAMQA